MRKIPLILICAFLTMGAAGYNGSLPNVQGDFAYKKKAPEVSTPPFTPAENEDQLELKKIPRENKSYLEIIIKKDKTAQYTKDINNIILLLEKLKTCIESQQDIQKFNAIVSNLIDHISFVEAEYKDKPEANYMSYKNLKQLSQEARNVAVLRTESQIYNKYLPYSAQGAAYTQKNITNQLQILLSSVNNSLYILKNID